MPFKRLRVTKMGNFLVCMREAFDIPPGMSMMDFAEEMKQLDGMDRAFFITELDKLGYRVVN